jgi:hypothetical protein
MSMDAESEELSSAVMTSFFELVTVWPFVCAKVDERLDGLVV